jgi:hypothetical protein
VPNASKKRPAPPKDLIAGESVFVVWDVANCDVEDAQATCRQIREKGCTVIGCSLDERVKRDRSCPVCGQKGLA